MCNTQFGKAVDRNGANREETPMASTITDTRPVRGLRNLRRALVGAIAVSGLSIGTAAAGSIDLWTLFSGPDGAAIDALVKKFNATAGKEADVQVNLLIIPWDDFNTKLSVAMASRKAPALTIVNSDQVPVYAKQGAVEPFTNEELAAAGIAKSDYVPAAWEAGAYKGKQYGVPISIFPRNIYYNKTLFEKAGLDPAKPPTTGAELKEQVAKITALGDGTFGLGFEVNGSDVYRNFYTLYWQYDDKLYNDDFTDVSSTFKATAEKVLEELKAFRDSGQASNVDIKDIDKAFAQGKTGIVISQITNLPVHQTAAKELGVKYGIAPMPTFGDKPAAFALAHEFLIPRGTSAEARKDGLAFIKWIGANGVDWAKTGKIPPQISVLESEEFKALPDQATVAEAIEIARFPEPLTVQPAIDRAAQRILEEYFAGRTTSDEAVEKLATMMRAELAKQ
jgi:multiple sugar transport system substrate-binding protein